MLNAIKSTPYGNWKVLSEHGEPMFRCDDKKANWYLKRNLARLVDAETIQLAFTTKGPGHVGDPFYLQDLSNRCVVCGKTTELTKHHVVPHSYRRWFPFAFKSHSYYDVLVLCVGCHLRCEVKSNELKKVIAKEYGIPVAGVVLKDEAALRAHKAGHALKHYRHHMTEERAQGLIADLARYFGEGEITEVLIEHAARIDPKCCQSHLQHGQHVVEQCTDLEAFVRRWRQHFLDSMKPAYLPQGWSVDRNVRGKRFTAEKSVL